MSIVCFVCFFYVMSVTLTQWDVLCKEFANHKCSWQATINAIDLYITVLNAYILIVIGFDRLIVHLST